MSGTVTVETSASDDVRVEKVDLYVDGTLVFGTPLALRVERDRSWLHVGDVNTRAFGDENSPAAYTRALPGMSPDAAEAVHCACRRGPDGRVGSGQRVAGAGG